MLRALKTERVAKLLSLAEVYRIAARIAREDDTGGSLYDRMLNGPEIPELKALTAAISALSKPEQDEFLALVWSGRSGAFSTELDVAVSRVKHDAIDQYLAGKPLPRYIRAGLEQLGYQVPD